MHLFGLDRPRTDAVIVANEIIPVAFTGRDSHACEL